MTARIPLASNKCHVSTTLCSALVFGSPCRRGLRAAAPQVVATGNRGCVMQLDAGLRAAGVRATLCHPVELLDASYAAAGHYA